MHIVMILTSSYIHHEPQNIPHFILSFTLPQYNILKDRNSTK